MVIMMMCRDQRGNLIANVLCQLEKQDLVPENPARLGMSVE